MSKTTTQKPQELLDRYLQGVRFWLPKAQQEDISAELAEDLHSQIEEKEEELGRSLNEEEMTAILKRFGSPIVVASRYRPQTHLIGPVLFPIYQFVLKVTLLWMLIPLFVVIVGPAMILPADNHIGAFWQVLSTLFTAMISSTVAITIVFAVIERTTSKCNILDKWDVRSLPPVPKPTPQHPSRTHTIFELIFGVIGLVWLLLVPSYPFLVLGPAARFLVPGTLWHTFYLPMVLLSAAGIVHQFLSLARPQWGWLPPTARLLVTVLTLVLVQSMIRALGQGTGADWHPFVAPAPGVAASAEAIKVAAVVNSIALISLLGTCLGLTIAAIKQTWDVLRYFRGPSESRNLALLKSLFESRRH